MTSIVNAIRDLLTGQPVGSDIWFALAWCAGILILAYVIAMAIYRRKISQEEDRLGGVVPAEPARSA